MRNESIIPWSQIYITKVLIHYKIIVEKKNITYQHIQYFTNILCNDIVVKGTIQ